MNETRSANDAFQKYWLKVISLELEYESGLTHISDVAFTYVLCHLNIIKSCLAFHLFQISF